MFTFRATVKLRKRLRVAVPTEEAKPTTALGDWCGNLLYFGSRQLVLCTSERSLLSVVLAARGLGRRLLPDLQSAVAAVLDRIGVNQAAVAREIAEMRPMTLSKAVNRSVLGSMNDFAIGMAYRFEAVPDMPLLELALELGETPCSPLGYDSPTAVARRLLGT